MPDAVPVRVHGDSRAWEVRVIRVLRLGRLELDRRVPSIVVVVREPDLHRAIDRFTVGAREVALPVASASGVRDGKIAAWRGYFDMAMYQRQLG